MSIVVFKLIMLVIVQIWSGAIISNAAKYRLSFKYMFLWLHDFLMSFIYKISQLLSGHPDTLASGWDLLRTMWTLRMRQWKQLLLYFSLNIILVVFMPNISRAHAPGRDMEEHEVIWRPEGWACTYLEMLALNSNSFEGQCLCAHTVGSIHKATTSVKNSP